MDSTCSHRRYSLITTQQIVGEYSTPSCCNTRSDNSKNVGRYTDTFRVSSIRIHFATDAGSIRCTLPYKKEGIQYPRHPFSRDCIKPSGSPLKAEDQLLIWGVPIGDSDLLASYRKR